MKHLGLKRTTWGSALKRASSADKRIEKGSEEHKRAEEVIFSNFIILVLNFFQRLFRE
jgi:hypothetical protein